MTFYEGQEVECDYCDGAGRITDEDYESWELCDGTGKTEAEPEDYEPDEE